MIDNHFNIDSIEAYTSLYGLRMQHPLVAVIDLRESDRKILSGQFSYGVYALYLKQGAACSVRYGRRKYDYQQGTVVSFAPGQVVDFEVRPETASNEVVGLLFHPDLIYGTPLASKIAEFSFFDYDEREAVHLSDQERSQFLHCLDQIRMELSHPVDHHSAALLSANIQVLLEYLYRFYDRQFITRHKVNSEVVANFQRELKSYYESGRLRSGVPGVAYFAEKACLSPGYFGDLIRKETGASPKDLISLYLISEAKRRLVETADDINSIAYDLGFEYPGHFSRMFKRITGQTPTQYRVSVQ